MKPAVVATRAGDAGIAGTGTVVGTPTAAAPVAATPGFKL